MLVVAGAVAPAGASALGAPTSLTSTPNPSSACGNVTFTATVFGLPFPANPEGLVQFFDGGSLLGGPQAITPDFDTFLGAHVVPTNHSSTTLTVSLPGGNHTITFGYLGTAGASTGGPLEQRVTAPTSTTTVSSAVNPSVYGQTVPLTATVSGSCSGTVAGTVQFRADGADLGGPRPVDGAGHATLDTSALAVGTHPIDATFTSSSGDLTGSSGSLAGGQVVKPADTSTAVSSSADPSEFGAPVTLTAATTVDPPGAGSPTGNVQFADAGSPLGAARAVDGTGHASIVTSGLAVGSHPITAAFTSDSPNFNGSDGSATQVVTEARTTLHYDGATTADFNDPAVLSARLTRTDDGSPIAGKAVTLTMGAESCTHTTGPDGEAACTITPSEPAGPFTATGAFADDGNYRASSDTAAFTVTREETTTAYTGPSVIAQGQPVALSGRLLEDGTSPIAGRTLTLTLGSGAGAQNCTGTTDAAGNATCTVASVTVGQGDEPVRADFAGDGYYLPSADAAKHVIVFAFPARGIFVVGDAAAAATPANVTYWGAQWSRLNALATGAAPAAFKGFAATPGSTPPACGATWTTGPGNSAKPVDAVPAYMGTAVATRVDQAGSAISGPTTHIVVIATAPGYASDPGHAGTGRIVATYC
jgi:hypothetical protein